MSTNATLLDDGTSFDFLNDPVTCGCALEVWNDEDVAGAEHDVREYEAVETQQREYDLLIAMSISDNIQCISYVHSGPFIVE